MKKQQIIFHGWLIVTAGAFVGALGYGARYSFSVIFPSLLEEFQWPRDITAAILSVHLLTYGLVAPLAGDLVDRLGPRRTMAFGTLLLTLGLALSGWASKPWHFYLTFGVLSGAGLSLVGAVPFTTVIRNWFERQRGLALSLLFVGSGIAWVFYPAIAFLIDRVNWRNTFRIEGMVIAAVFLPLIFLIVRYHPRQKGLFFDGLLGTGGLTSPTPGKEASRIRDQAWTAIDWTLPKAARTRRFWMLCLSTFTLWGIMEHIIVTHHVAFAIDLGYSRIYASSVLSLFGILFSVGSLASVVSDRIGREPTMTIGTVIGISGILVLTLMRDASHPWMLYYHAIALGFGFGMVSVTIAASVTDIFQGPRVGGVIGFIWFAFAIGGTIGPWLGGWIFELTNSYLVAFIVAMFMYAVSCAAIWYAGPRKVRLVPRMAKIGTS
ncbi:MAG: MFS transporter [Pseudomonadota bacterium]